jgi:glutamate-1-semialdehyde 2,1-aminomutase
MHNKGIRIIGRGLWYISAAHTEQEIDHAVKTAKEVLGKM